MIETHPLGVFAPPKAEYLVLGSFTTKEAYDETKKKLYIWFYANGGRNQFWPILEEIYGVELETRKQMQKLCRSLHLALADIVYQCERSKHSNLDVSLTKLVYNTDGITKLLKHHPIKKIMFTSRYVENKYRQHFKELIKLYPNIELATLPSPSPRYVLMTRTNKVTKYKEIFPRLQE